MCNCNKRAEYVTEHSDHSFLRSRRGQTKVKLVKNKPIVLNGDITGRMYVFREMNDIILVDNRDAAYMKHIKELQVLS